MNASNTPAVAAADNTVDALYNANPPVIKPACRLTGLMPPCQQQRRLMPV